MKESRHSQIIRTSLIGVVTNVLLATFKARAMGFDTLIMGMRYADELRKVFDIPENEELMAVIALGYRAQEPRIPTHRPLEEVVKFY